MKKQYIKPSVEEIKVAATSMLAASGFGKNDQEVITSDEGVQYGRDDRPSNPNLWDRQW